MKRIVFKLRLYRSSAKMSQMSVADQLSLSHRSYQRIEKEEAHCDVCFLYRFCNLFGVDFNALASPAPPRINENMRFFQHIDELDGLECLKFISYSKIIELNHKLESNQVLVQEIAESMTFMNSNYHLYITTPLKKILNNIASKTSQLLNKQDNLECFFDDINQQVHFWDCLYYHRPKYSLRSNILFDANGSKLEIQVFSIHVYQIENITNFNLAILKYL
jgi:DNA-binding XRE family transcriptional regulator